MSKTIDLQVQKSVTLINALRGRLDEVRDKGISLESLDAMQQRLEELQENAKEVETFRVKLSEQVKKTNAILTECKNAFINTKAVVRNNFLQEEWIKYGVTDKR